MIPTAPSHAALRALLELCALVVLAWWGFASGAGPVGKVVLGVGVPLAAGLLWRAFVPCLDVSSALRVLVQVLVLGGAAAALAAVAAPPLAAAFAAAAAVGVALTLRPAA